MEEQACRQHREILDSVRSGDSTRTEEAIREHLGNIRARLSIPAPQVPHTVTMNAYDR
ncbi:hypothetical protein GCM10010384_24130 [Streptomyces djakartensis]|uniref:GntR C-terminal domain-containing protein n=1 Tax=Streptomyces djakartensis TaxID=68193 RepID=A0ABQ2ZLE1_9ACTN|nr:hypothetical protein GCM10010384_24130 [Streptomyces djakartensis]